MRVGIVRTQVPFVNGGAERHAARLCEAMNEYGHEAVEITMPFKWYPGSSLTNSILAAKLTDLSEFEGVPIDLLVGLKFPAYLAHHPNKIFWIIHQHRQAYDQWDAKTSDLLHDSDGLALRHLIHEEDRAALQSTPHPIFANSQNVSQRLRTYLGIGSTPLYHPPPMAEKMRQDRFGDYLFFPGRLNPSKRPGLVLQALANTDSSTRLVVAGTAENPAYQKSLFQEAKRYNLEDRIEWRGAVDDSTMVRLYAEARAVVFVPHDEDYGYISLEAMLSGKPIITVKDSGGPLEFIRDGKEGLVVEPNPSALGQAFERVMQDKSFAEQLGAAGASRYRSLKISWESVVETLTGKQASASQPLFGIKRLPKNKLTTKIKQLGEVKKLQRAVAPGNQKVALPFHSIANVLSAYKFETLLKGEDPQKVEVNPGLERYLATHWQRFLTTLDLIRDYDPRRILNIGVFPPFVFEAMLKNVFPNAEISGVWEGPQPYSQHVRSRDGQYPDFEVKLKPANIEQDVLPYGDGQFDLVLGMEILEHLALDPNFFLREISRVLRSDGHMLLSTPNIASHRGVWKILNGQAPYSFGVFVPTGGVYGRHNREYAPKEVAKLAQSAGFATKKLKTVDVYDDKVDPATAQMLIERNDDLSLRGETIFYVGQKSGVFGKAPEELYHGNPVAMSGRLFLRHQENETGLLVVEAENRSPVWWPVSGKQAICFLVQWINADGYLVHSKAFLPFQDAVAPGEMYRQSIRLNLGPKDKPNGTLVIHLFQTGVGSFTGTGRANCLNISCSETAFLKLVTTHSKLG